MTRKNENPQKAAMREMMSEYIKSNNLSVKSGTDIKSIMRDMMSVLLEGALDGELDESLGYSKYDYNSKNTSNSRNGHSKKTMHTRYGDVDINIPRDRAGEFEPQLIKNIRILFHRIWKNKLYLCMLKERPHRILKRFVRAFCF